MRRPVLTCTLLICLLVPSAKLVSQTQPGATVPTATATTAPVLANPQTPQEFFARARQLSDLEASGIPFHLKATFVATGNTEFTGNGTYEEWWQSKDVWRKEATLGDYKYVAVKNGGDEKQYATSAYVPLRLRQALDAILIQIAPDTGTKYKWKLKHTKMSGLDLTVLSSADQCGYKFPGATCPAQDYFTETGVLRSRLQDAIEDLYNGFQPFQNLLIPRSISVFLDETAVLTISITTLEELGPHGAILLKNDLAPTNMLSITLPLGLKPGPDVKPSRLVNQVSPNYPSLAKQRRLEGTVLMNASIDYKGNVREPYVIESVGPLLDNAALDAVRQWKYEPLEIHGTPYSINTTIAVVFALDR